MFLENLRLKLRHILWPYVRTLLLLALVVAGVNALLFFYLPLFEPPYWLWVIVGPMVLAALLVWQLWGSFQLVSSVQLGRSNLREVVVVVAFGTLAFAAGLLPSLIKRMVSPLCRLASIRQLPSALPARYYQVPHLLVDTQRAGWHETQATRKGVTYFRLFAACPVWADTARRASPPFAWVGFQYVTSYSYTDDVMAETATRNRFRQACKLALPGENTRYFDHLERCPSTGQRTSLCQAVQDSPSYHEASQPPLLLLPVATSLPAEARQQLQELQIIQLIGNGLFLLLIILSPLNERRKLEQTNSYYRRR